MEFFHSTFVPLKSFLNKLSKQHFLKVSVRPYYHSVQNSPVLFISCIVKAKVFTGDYKALLYQSPLPRLQILQRKGRNGAQEVMGTDTVEFCFFASTAASVIPQHRVLPPIQVALLCLLQVFAHMETFQRSLTWLCCLGFNNSGTSYPPSLPNCSLHQAALHSYVLRCIHNIFLYCVLCLFPLEYKFQHQGFRPVAGRKITWNKLLLWVNESHRQSSGLY